MIYSVEFILLLAVEILYFRIVQISLTSLTNPIVGHRTISIR